jgi:hypothetical protein
MGAARGYIIPHSLAYGSGSSDARAEPLSLGMKELGQRPTYL